MAATRRSARGVSAYEVSMPFVPMKAVLLDGRSAGLPCYRVQALNFSDAQIKRSDHTG